MGPVIDRAAVARFEDAVARIHALGADGGIVHGGERLDHGDLAHGHYCAPTIARAPLVASVCGSASCSRRSCSSRRSRSLDEALAHANASDYGLTAGFYGDAG